MTINKQKVFPDDDSVEEIKEVVTQIHVSESKKEDKMSCHL